jgi:type IV pilus assembly protein PilM
MLNSKSFLAVDFGAGSLKLAEFEVNEAGGLRLRQYGLKPLGPEGAQDSTREAAILKALQAFIVENGVKSKVVNVCAPGFHVFSKFVKLPPVEASKVSQIIQYEAQQNVPFPLAEVVWDYQILGTTASGELEVLLVAIKSDIVEGLFRVTEAAGLNLQLTDVSAAGLCNAFRYNYGDIEDCTMLLDIGAKTCNLLFFEKGKVFSRSINLGANSITQDFANESKLKFDAAEKLKIEEGFVSLGGAYEEPENPHQAAISKIARQFMTRLHIQVNQTMQFYRGQQGGSAPQRLFLSGGASVMPYTAQFFAEKLNVPVEYFNPLRNVQIDPSINLEDLARVAHSLGEVVGLGLRNLAHCPVELNLMPASTLKWQSFNQKKPYFITTIFGLVALIAALGFLFGQLTSVQNTELEKTQTQLEPMRRKAEQFKRAYTSLQKTEKELGEYSSWVGERFAWVDVLGEVRQALMRSEASMKARFRTDTGIWVEQLSSFAMVSSAGVETPSTESSGTQVVGAMDNEARRRFMQRYGLRTMGGGAAATPEAQPQADTTATEPAAKKTASNTNEVANVSITFRAVSLSAAGAGANQELVFSVIDEIRKSPLFDEKETTSSGNIGNEEPPGTFNFGVNVKLKHPIKL